MITMTAEQKDTTKVMQNAPRIDCAPKSREELRAQMRDHLVQRQRVYDKLGRA